MNREILEILACPIDKFHPLDLFECKTEIEKIVEGVLSVSYTHLRAHET